MKKIRNMLFVIAIAIMSIPNIACADPIDLAATGTAIVGYVGTAAGAALGIFGAIYGIRLMIRAFRAVK